MDEIFLLLASSGKINGQGGAAEMLKINPNTLRKRKEKLGILFGRKTNLCRFFNTTRDVPKLRIPGYRISCVQFG